MPPRPLHRWKSFWLGILILVFLGWAWVRSIEQIDSLTYKATSQRFALSAENLSGGCRLIWEDAPFDPVGLTFQSQTFASLFSATGRIWPLNTVKIGRPVYSVEGVEIFVAHWLLILLFLVPWTGFLGWRVRRVKRLAPGGAEPPARSST